MTTNARYSFLPWFRRGIANEAQAPVAGASRATVDVTVTLANDAGEASLPPRAVQLLGPGDVTGFKGHLVIRTEPRAGIADFEPNYLPCIEFYDEDFLWRYTPEPSDKAKHRLTPWLTLAVLEEHEFRRDREPPGARTSITLAADVDVEGVFARDDQLWAWAHVHLNGSLVGTGHSPNLEALDGMLRRNPDTGYCRLFSPRRLEENTAYHAFVIPTFKVGCQAGLGRAVSGAGNAIGLRTERQFPVYYEWAFATGPRGDFEDLVEALKPGPIPKEVGIRDMDVREPGFNLPTIHSPDVADPSEHVVGLEGALLSPFTVQKPLTPDSNFPPQIERQVNLATDALEVSPDSDPLITAPLYGRWHAMVERISALPADRNWVNELNDDPRFRAVAGMGTRVAQKNQEEYMKLAWQQIGDVLALNRKVAFVQMAQQVSHSFYVKHLEPLPDARGIALVSAIHSKVLGSPVTVRYLVKHSRITQAALTGPMRKLLRPRGLIARRALEPAARKGAHADLVQQANDGLISAAPARAAPTGPTLERALEAAAPGSGARWLVKNAGRLALLLLVLLVVLVLMIGGFESFVLLLAGTYAIYRGWRRLKHLGPAIVTVDALMPATVSPEAVAALPSNDAFVFTAGPTPAALAATPSGGPDSADARDLRVALMEYHRQLALRLPRPSPRPALALATVHAQVMRALEPSYAFPRRASTMLRVADHGISEFAKRYSDLPAALPAERIVPVMAYPDIKKPMYEPLRDISTDFFVPNLDLIPRNTISLMVQNEPFIEAYMVGLNHEFARELLWREYPTDQRPSTFRQFWDVSNYVDRKGLSSKDLAEELRDITRIHEWQHTSQLSDHNNRDKEGIFRNPTRMLERMVVLVIRGDLLRRYPHTVIFAQKARWGTAPQNPLHLVLYDETGEKSDPDVKDPNIRFPLYRASVTPDIHFIGFDLSLREVMGDKNLAETAAAKASIPADRLGWFFTLKEVVGEPRFGLDEHAVDDPDATSTWDNFSWEHLGNPKVIDVIAPLAKPLPATPNAADVHWGTNTNAADVANILYQKPVLVGIHAKEMLKGLVPDA